jgi:predicted RNA-binding protein
VVDMCESTIYLSENGIETEFMKDVTKIEFSDNSIICYDIIGEKREIPAGKIKIADLLNHKIIIEK